MTSRTPDNTHSFLGTLKRVLGCTRRYVALASFIVPAVKVAVAIVPVPPKETPWSSLVIEFRDKTALSWYLKPCHRDTGEWRDFLKWYHGRQRSACYVMRASEGPTMFQRCDIKGYSIRYGTETE